MPIDLQNLCLETGYMTVLAFDQVLDKIRVNACRERLIREIPDFKQHADAIERLKRRCLEHSE